VPACVLLRHWPTQEIVLVVPEGQAQLTVEELENEETCIIRASDPNAPDNITCFSYELQQFKLLPNVPKTAVHMDQTYACVQRRGLSNSLSHWSFL
jgi:hypothetical protein